MSEIVFDRPDRFLLLSPGGKARVARLRSLSPLRAESKDLLHAESLASWNRVPIRIAVLHDDPDAALEAGLFPWREELWMMDPEAEWDRRFAQISPKFLVFRDTLETESAEVRISGFRFWDLAGFLRVEADSSYRLKLFETVSDQLWRLSRVHIRVMIPSRSGQQPRVTLAAIYASVSDDPNVLLRALSRSAFVHHIAEINAVTQVEAGDGVVTFVERTPWLGLEKGEIPSLSARYIHLATEQVRTVPLRDFHPDAFPLHIAPLQSGNFGMLFACPDRNRFALFWEEWAVGEDPRPVAAKPLNQRLTAEDLLRARVRVSPHGVIGIILTDPTLQGVGARMLDLALNAD